MSDDSPPCTCHACTKNNKRLRFIACPVCGNKRCPKASNHELECTSSNETGQKGSVYE